MPLPAFLAAALSRRLLLWAFPFLLLLGGLWLVALVPPPLWYRWQFPDETAFMAMRREASIAWRDAAAGRTAKAADPKLRAIGGPALPGKDRKCAGRLADLPSCRLYKPVPLARISPFLREAVLVGEDDRFREHGGIDWQSLRDAIGYRRDSFDLANPKDRAELQRVLPIAWQKRDKLRGASTITQQLAKNLWLSPSRNPLRKVKEAVATLQLEWMLPKDRILELYLNVVEFGPGIWGAEAAAQAYFKTSAANLTRQQAAALASVLPFPRTSNPAYRGARALRRQNLILRRMRGEAVTIEREADQDDLPGEPSAADSAATLPLPPALIPDSASTDSTPPVLPDSSASTTNPQ
ncbi:MAG: biosynthetic peptidoglycan transglycosylase [Gemmatimonadales bacterium]|nr:biosynthetic peptidoglycan transglycosylase [Gemmatimonadales bacterium]